MNLLALSFIAFAMSSAAIGLLVIIAAVVCRVSEENENKQ